MPVLNRALAANAPATFNNPFAGEIAEYQRQLNALQAEPAAPALSPEEIAARKHSANVNEVMGIVGQLTGDRGMSAAGAHLLRKAMAEQTRRVADHGEYDPQTGNLKMFPEYARQRREDMLSRQLANAESKGSMAQSAWDLQRQRAADAEALKMLALSNRQEPRGAQGTFSYAGVDPASGDPILLHSVSGNMVVKRKDGTTVPFGGGGIGPKPTIAGQEKVQARDAAVNKAQAVLAMVENTPGAFSTWKGTAEWATPEVLKSQVTKRLFTDPQRQVRGQVLAEAAVLTNELIGAAQTDRERIGLEPFIVRPTDDPEVAISKLRSAVAVAEREKMARQGGTTPGLPAGGAITPAAAAVAPPLAPPAPPATPIPAPVGERKVIGGQAYVKRDGKWYKE